jgi:predicted secreted Zn-dependent protease
VQVNSDVTFYSFAAGNVQEVQQALYTQGPEVDGAGQHSIALTNYEMWVTWEMTQSVTGCRMDDVIVHLDITYTYPQWIPAGTPPGELVGEWNRFMEHVTAHEEHHGMIARQCAAGLAMLLDSFDPGSICTESQSGLDTLVNDLYESCEIQQQAFDAAEGRTTFPLPAP